MPDSLTPARAWLGDQRTTAERRLHRLGNYLAG
jgi:hypothetical protein